MSATPAALAIGLQEWAVACRALGEGRLTLVVRKGGIHERQGGLFALEHERFALLPTHLHQDAGRLLPSYAGAYLASVAADAQPGRHAVGLWAEAARIWKVTELGRLAALGDELMWTEAELASRFRYRDQPWLFVVALRIQRLPVPLSIPDHPSYAGCRSWIPLRDQIPLAGSVPVLDETAFATRLSRITKTLDVV